MGTNYRQIIEQSIDEQAALWLTEADALPELYRKLRARALISEWALAAKDCAGAIGSASVSSYSIGGRSVTKSELINLVHRRDALERSIHEVLYGTNCVLSADLRGSFE